MTLLAVFQTLLYRYTGQEDIVVGSPIANRHYKETEDLIGFFVNTLALRTTFQEKDSFVDVLKRVQQTTLGAYQHQDVPFEQLVDHLNVNRSLNTNPVFQVIALRRVRHRDQPDRRHGHGQQDLSDGPPPPAAAGRHR
jgi:non-ribosomal peptide synthetase component F